MPHNATADGALTLTLTGVIALVAILLFSTLLSLPTITIAAGDPLAATQTSFAISTTDAIALGVGGLTFLLATVISLWTHFRRFRW